MKALKIGGIIVAVLIVAAIVFIATFDVSKYKGTIEAQAKAATGRDITIGDIKLTPSLTPAITLIDLKVANAPWGTRPEMLIAKRIEVHTELVPLIFGTIKLTKLVVDDPDAWLETDKSGKGNWDFSQPAKAPANAQAGQSSTPLNLDGVDIKNLKLAYKDAQAGRSADVAAKTIAVRLNGALQDMSISKVSVDSGTVAFKNGKTSGDAAIGKFVMDASGKITDLGITNISLSDAKATYKGEGAPTEATVDKLSLDKDGVLALNAKVNGQEIKAKGTLAPIAVLARLDKPFPAKLSLEGMGLKADTDLAVEIVNKRPHVKGSVTVPEINLASAQGASAAPAPAAKPTGEHLFPDTPLPWDMLSAMDAEVKLSLGKATLSSGLTLTNVLIPVNLTSGKFASSPFSVALGGGSLNGTLDLNAADKSMLIKAEGKGFTAEELAKQMKKGDFITGGPIEISTNIHGAGASMHAIVSDASGTFLLKMGESRIKNESLGGANALMQIAGALNPMGKSEPYTVTKCAVVNLPINNGVANVNNSIAIVTDKVQASAAGTIDLRNERIDLSLKPQGGGLVGAGVGQIAQALKVSGPLASPSVGIDAAGAMKSLATVGGVAATGGVGGLLGGALLGSKGGSLLGGNKTSGSQQAAAAPSGDPCQVALIGATK